MTRKGGVEDRPLAEFAFNPDTSTEEFCQPFAERQTEANTLYSTLDSGIDLDKVAKQLAQMVSRDADPGIRDREFYPARTGALRRYSHLTPASELERV